MLNLSSIQFPIAPQSISNAEYASTPDLLLEKLKEVINDFLDKQISCTHPLVILEVRFALHIVPLFPLQNSLSRSAIIRYLQNIFKFLFVVELREQHQKIKHQLLRDIEKKFLEFLKNIDIYDLNCSIDEKNFTELCKFLSTKKFEISIENLSFPKTNPLTYLNEIFENNPDRYRVGLKWGELYTPLIQLIVNILIDCVIIDNKQQLSTPKSISLKNQLAQLLTESHAKISFSFEAALQMAQNFMRAPIPPTAQSLESQRNLHLSGSISTGTLSTRPSPWQSTAQRVLKPIPIPPPGCRGSNYKLVFHKPEQPPPTSGITPVSNRSESALSISEGEKQRSNYRMPPPGCRGSSYKLTFHKSATVARLATPQLSVSETYESNLSRTQDSQVRVY